MENICSGTVVRSVKGRDKYRVFMIAGVCRDDSGRVYIADGKLHTLKKPKKKNLRHIAVLAAADADATSYLQGDDSELQKFLLKFEAE